MFLSQKKIAHLGRYLSFLVNSVSKYGLHSPAIYDLIAKELKSDIDKNTLEYFLNNRNELINNRRVVEVSHFKNIKNRVTYSIEMNRIGRLARKTSLHKKDGELLYRLVKRFKPAHIIELGTGFGLSTLYMAKANPEAKIYSLEGCANKAEVATSLFRRNELDNISLLTGIFDKLLQPLVDSIPAIDFAFIDGDHTAKGILNYLSVILPKCTEKTILVFHDIHWSSDMESGWKEIISNPAITVSVDFFFMGIVFFDKKLSKQNFSIRM